MSAPPTKPIVNPPNKYWCPTCGKGVPTAHGLKSHQGRMKGKCADRPAPKSQGPTTRPEEFHDGHDPSFVPPGFHGRPADPEPNFQLRPAPPAPEPFSGGEESDGESRMDVDTPEPARTTDGTVREPKEFVDVRGFRYNTEGVYFADDCHPPVPLDPSTIPPELLPKSPNAERPPHHPFPSMFAFELAHFANVEARLSDAQALALNKLLLSYFPGCEADILTPSQNRRLLKESEFALFGIRDVLKDGNGREYEFYHRDLLECVRDLIARAHLATQLSMEPEVHIRRTSEGLERVFGDVKTGDAWAEALALLPFGHVLIPLVLSSDKSLVRNRRSLWPIYLSCAMHSSDARASPSSDAAILVGYLVQPAQEHTDVAIMADASVINKEIFHSAIRMLFTKQFLAACETGTPMRFPNGQYFNAHPHLLIYIADLPELALVGLTKQNQTCPICNTSVDQFHLRCLHVTPRCTNEIIRNFTAASSGMLTKAAVEKKEKATGVHLSVRPAFWCLPNFNIYSAFSTDELHQLLIGAFGRHLCGALATECSNNNAFRLRLFRRLHAVPLFSSSTLRALSINDFTMLTGAEWQSLACVSSFAH
ncbi:hypothetical protein BCR44DRAFT_262540 [Catenaria anguillulae PL171]|uniref:Uncharacterized protein n=1 Tax=Catenaria anguillulae PL171 TaxID=765915 RepID=A0A1Y2I6E1_9FUNG|nr:hypothetical protein BCR44DRAFT_262540 [Catenaria anguillulae PL171]